MKNYQLIPNVGWHDFSHNNELKDHLYAVFMPLVNDGNWSYTNFTSDTGSFEDELGNSVLLEFENDFEENVDSIISLNVSIATAKKSEISFLEATLIKTANKFGLYKEKSSDAI